MINNHTESSNGLSKYFSICLLPKTFFFSEFVFGVITLKKKFASKNSLNLKNVRMPDASTSKIKLALTFLKQKLHIEIILFLNYICVFEFFIWISIHLNYYIPLYAGPPPPSGTTQLIFCDASLMSHVLQ